MRIAPGKTALIRARSKRRPYIIHLGIAYNGPNDEILVAHNSRKGKNDVGGNVTVDTLSHVLKNRWFTGWHILPLSQAELAEYVAQNQHRKFDTTNYNCEHFVYGFTGEPRSPQLIGWVVFALVIILFACLNRKSLGV
jgi:hypothetical protein